MVKRNTCAVKNCGEAVWGFNLCRSHYDQRRLVTKHNRETINALVLRQVERREIERVYAMIDDLRVLSLREAKAFRPLIEANVGQLKHTLEMVMATLDEGYAREASLASVGDEEITEQFASINLT